MNSRKLLNKVYQSEKLTAHIRAPGLAKDHLAPMPRISRKRAHAHLDEILDWEPHFACYGGFKFFMLRWLESSMEAMDADLRAKPRKQRTRTQQPTLEDKLSLVLKHGTPAERRGIAFAVSRIHGHVKTRVKAKGGT